jgi:hypothetical protein
VQHPVCPPPKPRQSGQQHDAGRARRPAQPLHLLLQLSCVGLQSRLSPLAAVAAAATSTASAAISGTNLVHWQVLFIAILSRRQQMEHQSGIVCSTEAAGECL